MRNSRDIRLSHWPSWPVVIVLLQQMMLGLAAMIHAMLAAEDGLESLW
jgi:hypothetical protein